MIGPAVIGDDIFLGDRRAARGLDVFDEFQRVSLDEVVTVEN